MRKEERNSRDGEFVHFQGWTASVPSHFCPSYSNWSDCTEAVPPIQLPFGGLGFGEAAGFGDSELLGEGSDEGEELADAEGAGLS
jgi:hypothetical protein